MMKKEYSDDDYYYVPIKKKVMHKYILLNPKSEVDDFIDAVNDITDTVISSVIQKRSNHKEDLKKKHIHVDPEDLMDSIPYASDPKFQNDMYQ